MVKLSNSCFKEGIAFGGLGFDVVLYNQEGNIINFEIKDNQLIPKIGGQISPAGGYIGDIQITYIFKDKMYQAKSIEFKPSE